MKMIAAAGVALSGLFCSAAMGQHFTYGVIGGSALTDDFNTRYVNSFEGYAISPTLYQPGQRGSAMGGLLLEWHFSDGLSVEADGLFRQLHYSVGSLKEVVGTGEIPVLAKYRLEGWDAGGTHVRPFLEAGATARVMGGTQGTDPSRIGATAGGGLEFHVQHWTIAPTLRYTRWRRDDPNFGVPSTRPDQLELLVGFSHTPDHLVRQFTQLHRFSVGGLAGVNLLGDYHQFSESRSGTGTAIDGTPYSYQYSTFINSGERSFLPGGSLEFRIGKGFSVEGDFIFRPVRQDFSSYSFTSSGTSSSSFGYSGDSTMDTWQFPLLLKYETPRPLPKTRDWKPFVEAGVDFRTPSGEFSRTGFAAGLGVQKRVGLFKFAPELRYTRWQAPQYYYHLNADELNLFLGVSLW